MSVVLAAGMVVGIKEGKVELAVVSMEGLRQKKKAQRTDLPLKDS
jgi:hypothetical protein